jgi:ribosomal protein S18 acetylase RimI-like enzyme
MPDLVIRPYHLDDRQAVFRIGADTAFFGAPIEAYMEDRHAFLDAFYAYYTDLEPEHTWVACSDGEVVGFLAGCIDTRLHNRKLLRVIIPRLVGNLLRGKYHFGKRSWRYFGGMLGGLLRREFTRVDLDAYPAHLHINVESAWRGYKLGQRLMEAWLGQLREMGIPGVYLDTTSLNEVACRLYEKMGFRLLDARSDRFWTNWFGHPVDNRCYGLKLLD